MPVAVWRSWLRRYAVALSAPPLLTVGLLAGGQQLSGASAALLYQLAVLAVAVVAGLGPSMLAALASTLAFHYFFVPAHFSFKPERWEDLVRLGVFLAVAVTTSGLAGRAREQAEVARRRAAETASLYELSQLISAQVELAAILPTIARTTCRLLRAPGCAILLAAPDGELREQCRVGALGANGAAHEAALRDGAAPLGVLRIAAAADRPALAPHERQLLETLAAQASLAVARARLAQQAARSEALAQSDQLKSALIASVSHDLRTPLASIKGAATTLQSSALHLPPATRITLARTIEREADQLDRTVRNLLDMSRLEGGAIQLNCTWHDLPELIGVALQRLGPALHGRAVAVRVDPELPLVWANAVLIEHVLTNLLENVLKYTPPGSPVEIAAAVDPRAAPPALALTIRDHGPGIAPDELEPIFEKFYRGRATSQHVRGSGLGLTICRGIAAAHGGALTAANCPDGRAAFTLTLPLGAGGPQAAGPRLWAAPDEEQHVQDPRADR